MEGSLVGYPVLMRSVVSQGYVGAEKRLRDYLQLRVCMKIALTPFRLTLELSGGGAVRLERVVRVHGENVCSSIAILR